MTWYLTFPTITWIQYLIFKHQTPITTTDRTGMLLARAVNTSKISIYPLKFVVMCELADLPSFGRL